MIDRGFWGGDTTRTIWYMCPPFTFWVDANHRIKRIFCNGRVCDEVDVYVAMEVI